MVSQFHLNIWHSIDIPMDLFNVMNFHIKKTNKQPKKYADFTDEQKAKMKQTQKKYYESEQGKHTRDAYYNQYDVKEKKKLYSREYYQNYHRKKTSED